MAAELLSVRRKFSERVSKEVITQLLDDLFEDHVFNDVEKEAIHEENQSRVQKACNLIDRLRKKGDVASKKMIDHLQERDPILFTELGLSADQPAQSAQPAQPVQPAQPAQPAQPVQPVQPTAEPGEEQEWSDRLKLTTEVFWKLKQNDKDVYPAGKSNIRNRVALLITNIKFKEERRNRKGAEKDEENMEKLLSALGYEVVRHTNLTAKEIDDALIKFSKHPKLRETDSVVVVLMSHGKLGAVLGVDSTEEQPDDFAIDKIYQHLGSVECPALLNKPKVIIIQASGCGGGSCSIQEGIHGSVNVIDDMNTVRWVHKEKDFISLLSSTPGTVSYRHIQNGSFFIKYIVEVFNTYAHADDIRELFRKVMRRFEDFTCGNRRQMPTEDRCTLTRRFYFFSGI
ncbi:caspase a-like [Mugil cephalus]|uniref:caspase a-like n=1 Tax=Mugil cephalus TaxID=48193 RepID=UPI001FB583B5|nr:caspase a-like [Mugil cephalus]